MANLGQMITDLDLMGMGNLEDSDVTVLINKVQREEIESYPWSFLFTNIIINGVPPYQNGNLTLTQGSNIAVGDGSGGQNFTTSMIGWFLWVGPTLTTPVIISGVPTSTSLLLSAPWGAPSTGPGGYTVQPRFYDVYPLQRVYRVMQIDFLTETSQEALNRIDPSRIATGGTPSQRWSPAPFNQSGHYQIELWPRISSALPYICDGRLSPIDLVNNTDLPMIPSQVIEAKAMMYYCRAQYAQSGNPKWGQLAETYKADYSSELDKAQYEDKQRAVPQGITSQGAGNRSFDAALDYNHDFGGPPDIGAYN